MYIDKNKLYIGAVAAAIIVSGFVYITFFATASQPALILNTDPYTPSIITIIEEEEELPIPPQSVVVFISGEVNYPSVFELDYGARVVDVLELAGGATQYADLNRINLAAFISDEQHIIIPAFGQELQQEEQAATTSNLININTASLSMLTTLPGIGPVIGQNIIDHREQNGPFSSIDQIQNVNRIGPTIFNNIESLITVG